MRPRKLDHSAIEADWFDRELTREEIAARHKTTPKTVSTVWAAAITEHRLPDQDRRAYFAANPPADALDDDDESDLIMRVPDGDPLLAALRRHHGNDPRRQHDDVRDARGAWAAPAVLAAMALNADTFNRNDVRARRK